MSNYEEYYYSDERQVGRGLMMIGLGIGACFIPGAQAVGVKGIVGGVAKIATTIAISGVKQEIRDRKDKGK